MIEKMFSTDRGREVVIKITDEHILFYHNDAIKQQERWVIHQEELGNEVSDEEKKVEEFYWIEKQHWVNDFTQRLDREDNWHQHMKIKTWFTDEMYEFINSGCMLNTI